MIFLLCSLFVPCVCSAVQTLSEQVSRDLEFAGTAFEHGVRDGDSLKMAQAHRVLSALDATIGELGDAEKETLFYVAVAYTYVNACPHTIFQQILEPGAETDAIVNCIDEGAKYLSKALVHAQINLNRKSAADTYFLVAVGMDRLKANLAGTPGVEIDKYRKLAFENFLKARALGTSYAGIEVIINGFERGEYQKKPVIDEERFSALYRTLVYDNDFELSPEKKISSSDLEFVSSADVSQPVIDGDVFVDYRWRFSVERPDDSWKFDAREKKGALSVKITKKDEAGRKGSGLRITCRPLSPSRAEKAASDSIKESVKILETAGYEVKSQKKITLSGTPAWEILSAHTYEELVSAGGDAKKGGALTSKQYMIVAWSSEIQYVISFAGLKSEYARIFHEYKSIADTVVFF